jgi:hypothetical protein
MATSATAPKRVEPEVIQTVTFNDRDAAKKALVPMPEEIPGFEWELATCSQEVDGKHYVRAYWKPQVSSIDGVLALAESDPIGLLKDLNYGSGLYFNSLVREQIAAENSGPAEQAKSFEKQVKEFMKQRASLNKPVSEEKARQVVKAMLEVE